jgi:hypothetical protein
VFVTNVRDDSAQTAERIADRKASFAGKARRVDEKEDSMTGRGGV